jgi:hypothetical protein
MPSRAGPPSKRGLPALGTEIAASPHVGYERLTGVGHDKDDRLVLIALAADIYPGDAAGE